VDPSATSLSLIEPLGLNSTVLSGQEGKTCPTERLGFNEEGPRREMSSIGVRLFVLFLMNKVLRFEYVGLTPSRTDCANRDSHGFLAVSGNPHGFFAMGDVMILRPCLVAWPEGSEWRTQRLVVTHQAKEQYEAVHE
jgi:hypothetical protein